MRPMNLTHGRAPRGPALLLALALVPLAGCLGAADDPAPIARTHDPPPPGLTAPDGRDLRLELTTQDQVGPPSWTAGDWFGVHVYFGASDTTGTHYNSIVVDATGASYRLATDALDVAKLHALFGIPILGTIPKDDLRMTGLGGEWDLYDFPLTDGKTWQGRMWQPVDDFEGVYWDATFHAVYNPAIETPGGARPGYDITATDTDGNIRITYDYVPDIGWFAHMTYHAADTPSPDDILFDAVSMGHGHDWHGQAYELAATPLAEGFDGSGLDNAPPQGQPVFEPQPYLAFDMPTDAHYLFGILAWGAVAGVREIVVVPPEGEPRTYQAVGAPEAFSFTWIDEAALPGSWNIVTVGAGAFSYSYVLLYALHETLHTL